METDPRIPEDVLTFIKDGIKRGRIHWTYHVNMRLAGRFISRQSILEALDSYELIESYPSDKYLPSFLIFGKKEARSFHVLTYCLLLMLKVIISGSSQPTIQTLLNGRRILRRGDKPDEMLHLWWTDATCPYGSAFQAR
ncbi:MAG: DUF4258 domain-containing protein [Acidobacteriota bacterium]